MGAPTFHPGSHVSLYPLIIRQEDDEFIVGRVDMGTFASVPEVGVRALGYLRQGNSLAEIEARLAAEDGSTVDLQAFVADLMDLGFIAAVDENPVLPSETARNHLPWLKPDYVRWVFSRPIAVVYGVILTVAAVTIVRRPDLLPRTTDFFWSPLLSLVIAVNLLLGWLQVGSHELAHLVAARAEGLPAHIRPGTRLQYLVLQTDVSGAWSLPRSGRYRIYLAGVLWELLVLSLLILVLAYGGLPSIGQALLGAWSLIIFFGLLGEFAFYMRTDIYFVFQDLLHSRNLFQDAQHLLAHRLGRAIYKLLPKPGVLPSDPLLAFAPSDRRKVVFYACLLSAGTIISLGRYVLIVIPILIQLISQAAEGLVSGLRTHNATGLIDGGFTLLALVGTQTLFVAAFFQSHRRGLASAVASVAKVLARHPPSHPDSAPSDAPPVPAP